MNPNDNREKYRPDCINKMRKVRNELEPHVLVDERTRQEIAASPARHVGEDDQSEDDGLIAPRGTVFGERHVPATQAVEAVVVECDESRAGFGVVFHGGLDGDAVAGAAGGDDEIGEGQVLHSGALGFVRGDPVVCLQVELEGVGMVGVHVLDDEVLGRHGGLVKVGRV